MILVGTLAIQGFAGAIRHSNRASYFQASR